EDRAHGAAVHLPVHFLVVASGRGREHLAAAAEQGAANGAGTGPPGALLAPGLPVAAGHRGAVLLRAGTGTRRRQVRDHYLVDQRLLEIDTEHGVAQIDVARGGAFEALNVHLHFRILRQDCRERLTDGVTMTSCPLGPGIDPLTSSRLRSVSMRTTSRFCWVAGLAPMCPAIFLPGNTRPGSWFWPIEPGLRCALELPWVARPPPKPCRLMTPANPRPITVPRTST